jgi:hypothetical protein
MVPQLMKQIEQSLNKSGVLGYGAGVVCFLFYISKVYYKHLKNKKKLCFPRTIICSTSTIFQKHHSERTKI